MFNKVVILLVFIVLFLSSCRKEVIKPSENECSPKYLEENVYFSSNSFSKLAQEDSNEDYSDKSGLETINNNSSLDTLTSSSTNDSNITDPNQDPDANKRKGKK